MPTSNILVFNPGQVNQETDAAYNADSNRAGGFPTNAIWQSILANKSLYQLSTMLKALANIVVAEGFDCNDTNLATLTTNMTSALLALAGGGSSPSVVVVAFSPTPGFVTNTKPVCNLQMTLTGNVTSSTLTGVHPGQIVNFIIAQDATGGRTFSPPPGIPMALIDPTPNLASVQSFLVDAGGNFRTLGPMTSS